jgi:transposase
MEAKMVRPDPAKWGQTLADLRRLSVDAEHVRTRERFLALYMIGTHQTNATRWAVEIGRDDNTIIGWVHTYNKLGPEALYYHRTGGRTPFLTKNRSNRS